MHQIVFGWVKDNDVPTNVFEDSRSTFLYFSLLSIVLLAVRLILVKLSSLNRVLRKLRPEADEIERVNLSVDGPGYDSSVLKNLEARTKAIQSSRVVVCFVLFALTGYLSHRQHGSRLGVNTILLPCYAYTCLLSLGAVLLPLRWRRTSSQHLSLILLGDLCIYVIRDLIPLATKHKSADAKDGWLAVARLILLFIGGFLIPIVLPRPYHPIDPENPKTPSSYQTASWLSKATFSFVDSIVWTANKSAELDVETLPALADSYHSRHLASTAFPNLDPVLLKKPRHLFWGIVITFRKQYIQQLFLESLGVVNQFASPVATLKLLEYIEAEDRESLVQPWVWILWLGFGPAIASICEQTYLYLTTVILVRMEAIITQLIFEHSLRIRVNSHLAKSGDSKVNTSAQTTPTVASSAASVAGDSDEGIDPAVTESTITGSTAVGTSTMTISETQSEAESGKGKSKGGKDKTHGPKNTAQKIEDQSGKIMTMVTSDIKTLQMGNDWLSIFFFVARTVVCIVFLYQLLGWSALVGIGFIIITFPLPGSVAKLLMSIQEEKMKRTDSRIQNINQVMNVLRMVKLFAWEDKVKAQIAEKREDELRYIRNSEILDAATGALNTFIPLATMLVVYSTYTLVMGKDLKASVIFPSAAVFSIFRGVVYQAFWIIPSVLRSKITLDRIGGYLRGGELFEPLRQSELAFSEDILSKRAPYLRDASFTWSKPGVGSHTPGRRNFQLQIEGELAFKEGKVNLICGPTGCGKTSLLMALLGEMYFNPAGPSSVCHLPREEGIAYAAQESWVINETIKQNILFQTPYDKERYEKVLNQVGLERDLLLLEAGDMTEVGEKGLTLSGGQKARITLARAVYSKAKILLLDDVLSALDVHTARWVTENCLGGDLLEGRTVLLVTHNVALAGQISDFVVVLGLDGKVNNQGSMSEVLRSDSRLLKRAAKRTERAAKAEGAEKSVPKEKGDEPAGKLIVKEEVGIGHVSWKAANLYLSSLGGMFFWMIIIPAIAVIPVIPVLENWFLGYWSSQYELHPGEPLPVKLYLLSYGLILLSDIFFFSLAHLTYILGVVRASRTLHAKLMNSILASTFRWLDTVPVSRIITRFSQDCSTLDGLFGNISFFTTVLVMSVFVSFLTVVISVGWPAVPPAIIVAVVILTCGHLYINAQMPVKRNMSNNRAPILGHLSNVLSGIVSVRAYGAQSSFRDESLRRIDVYSRTAVSYWNLNRWIGFRMDAIGGFFSGVVAIWLIYGSTIPAGSVGFTLSIISSFTGMLLACIRMFNETEVQANSIERIQQYLEIDHEAPASEDGKPPAHWPSSGELLVEDLTARYSADGPTVLSGLTFHIRSGERVGIVGRTGAGKSTIANALLRAIPIEGTVLYDGRKTSDTNLDALRSNITIIPQHPELLNGTLRENLDPFDEHDDAFLNSALHSAGLSRLQEDDEGAITLDTEVQAGGTNFSQGQRQVLALARAMVRRSKLLILDEATAAIDFDTDQAIQQSLRTELHDVTLLTVAHRLKTIMDYNKIMVLDAGRLVEFDTPQNLLAKKSGLFFNLVEESSDRDELYHLAGL